MNERLIEEVSKLQPCENGLRVLKNIKIDLEKIKKIELNNFEYFDFLTWLKEKNLLKNLIEIKIIYKDKDYRLFKYNKKGFLIYQNHSNKFWRKYKYSLNGNLIFSNTSNDTWEKYKYDEKGNKIYYEDSYKKWNKWEYDENNNLVYFESLDGKFIKYEYNENNLLIKEIDNNKEENILKYKIK